MIFIKIKLKSIINNIDNNEKNVYNLEGKKNANKVSYYDGEYLNEITISLNTITLLRKSNEVEYILIFDKNKKTQTKYNINKHNIFINIEVITQDIEIKENKIKIKYTQIIDSMKQDFEYVLAWEEI